MPFAVRRLAKAIVIGALCCLAAVLVACGDDEGLLSPDDASRLNAALDGVAAACSDGRVDAALDATERFRRRVEALRSPAVDRRLIAHLRDGADELRRLVPDTCDGEGTGTTRTDTTPTVTTPEPTEPTETVPTTPTETPTTPDADGGPTPPDGGDGGGGSGGGPTTPSGGGGGRAAPPSGGTNQPGGSGGSGGGGGTGGAGGGGGGTGGSGGSGGTGGTGGDSGGGNAPNVNRGNPGGAIAPEQGGTAP